MAELKVGDRVYDHMDLSGQAVYRRAGVVIAIGTPTAFGIPLTLLAHRRDEPLVRVRWRGERMSPDESETTLMWPENLTLLPDSLDPDDVEQWLADG